MCISIPSEGRSMKKKFVYLDSTPVPRSFAKRIANAIMPTLKGVGEGLSPVEKLRAQGKALLAGAKKREAERKVDAAKVTTCIAIAKASKK